jgi:hypothetical protein
LTLLTGCIAYKRGLSATLRNILRLRSFDLAIDKLFQSKTRAFSRRLDFLLSWAFHSPARFVKVFSVCKWDEILELGLDHSVRIVALLCNRVVQHIAFRVNSQCERISSRCLNLLMKQDG